MDKLRQDTAKQYRSIRRILKGGREPQCTCSICENNHAQAGGDVCMLIALLLLSGLFLIAGCVLATPAHAEDIAGHPIKRWVYAIGRAENSVSHPYGIMVKYRHTSPQKACENTIRHKYHNYLKLPLQTRQRMAFLTYLSRHYAPVGCNTDNGTNRFWVSNVGYYLNKEEL